MKCFRCAKGNMVTRVTEIQSNVRGESFTVQAEALVCPRCGDVTLTEEQSLSYSVISADAYRKAHSLLTTAEMKAARRRLGLSQKQFADRLRVGIASVKRWEAGAIQDESSDKLIRLCTDPKEARANLREIERLTA